MGGRERGGRGGEGCARRLAVAVLTVLLVGLAPPASPQVSAPQDPQPPPVRALRTGGLKAEVAALIMSGQEGGALPIEVLALPVPAAEGKARVPILVEIAGPPLLAGHDGGPLRFEIYAYALAAGGGLQASLMQTFEVDPERVGPRLAESGVKFSGEIELSPGEYSLRVLVRRPVGDEVGARTLPLAVPAGGEEPQLLPPLLAEPAGAWLELSETRERGVPARERLALLSQPPAAKPLLPLGEDVTFRLPAYRLATVGSELAVEIRDAGGGGAAPRTIELPARLRADNPAAGLRVLTADFFPDGLRAGDYELRVVLGADGERLASPFLPVRFTAETGGTVWPAAAASPPAEVRAAETTTAAKTAPARLKDDPQITAAYADALRPLAAGDPRAARTRLFELAESLARDQGLEGLKLLDRVELEVARSLAKADPGALAPVTMLHHWLYQEARRRDLSLLSTHARNSTLRLVEITLDFPSLASQKRAARVLASLGGMLQQADQIRFSQRVFRRALTVDSGNRAACLGLAVNHEKIGDWETAAEHLTTLVEAYPQDGEGRLRLAVNLRRLERKKAAQRHLEEVLAGEHPRWVLSLASQELARHEIEGGDLDRAVEILDAAIARLPGSQKLYLQLAFLHDARQEPEAARRTLVEMSLRASSRDPSSRRRYTRWPTAALEETRRELAAETASRRGELAAALAAGGWPLEEGP